MTNTINGLQAEVMKIDSLSGELADHLETFKGINDILTDITTEFDSVDLEGNKDMEVAGKYAASRVNILRKLMFSTVQEMDRLQQQLANSNESIHRTLNSRELQANA